MDLIVDGRLSPAATMVLGLLMVAGCLIAAARLWRAMRREEQGQEFHAHDDGTVHSHWAGARPHAHPTRVERYDQMLTRLFGPA